MWAKITGYPAYPARVQEFRGRSVEVEFITPKKQRARVRMRTIHRYGADDTQLRKGSKSKSFSESLKEADALLVDLEGRPCSSTPFVCSTTKQDAGGDELDQETGVVEEVPKKVPFYKLKKPKRRPPLGPPRKPISQREAHLMVLHRRYLQKPGMC